MSERQIEGVVLVVGGSGYLGLHLLQYLATCTRVRLAFTYSRSNSPPSAPFLRDVPSFRVDLRNGAGLKEISDALGPPSAVVNCAAISVPRECEENPELADGVNVPRSVLQWLKSFDHNKPLLVHLSTDQVYAGSKSFYKEEDETKPVNVYGKTKVDAEKYIRANWPNYAILRSSIIYGPQPAVPLPKTLPIQWIDNTLATGTKTNFFSDEFRCPVYVKDVVKVVVLLMLNLMAEGGFAQVLLNVGGPERLSRARMAELVAQVRGHDLALVNHVSASTVNRGVKSPPDISMNISKVCSLLRINMTQFSEGVKETFEDAPAVPASVNETSEETSPNVPAGDKETFENRTPASVEETSEGTSPTVPADAKETFEDSVSASVNESEETSPAVPAGAKETFDDSPPAVPASVKETVEDNGPKLGED